MPHVPVRTKPQPTVQHQPALPWVPRPPDLAHAVREAGVLRIQRVCMWRGSPNGEPGPCGADERAHKPTGSGSSRGGGGGGAIPRPHAGVGVALALSPEAVHVVCTAWNSAACNSITAGSSCLCWLVSRQCRLGGGATHKDGQLAKQGRHQGEQAAVLQPLVIRVTGPEVEEARRGDLGLAAAESAALPVWWDGGWCTSA